VPRAGCELGNHLLGIDKRGYCDEGRLRGCALIFFFSLVGWEEGWRLRSLVRPFQDQHSCTRAEKHLSLLPFLLLKAAEPIGAF
jgi:hypothetical protein